MILITRPKKEANILANILSEQNYKTFTEPLIKFQYLKTKIKNYPKKIFIITSQQAVVSIINNDCVEELKKAHLAVVGNSVKESLANIGVKKINCFGNDSDELRKKILKKRNYIFEYLSSNITNEEFVNYLLSQGIKITLHQTYNTVVKSKFTKIFLFNLRKNKLKAALFFSKLTAETFLDLINQTMDDELALSIKKIQIFCLSRRISDVFSSSKYCFGDIHTSPVPNQSNLLKLITRYYRD